MTNRVVAVVPTTRHPSVRLRRTWYAVASADGDKRTTTRRSPRPRSYPPSGPAGTGPVGVAMMLTCGPGVRSFTGSIPTW